MYQFDVFISYRRTSSARDWLLEYFYPKLLGYLRESLPHEPAIFLDQASIEPGAIWRSRIETGLRTSKCMVAILNAPYFTSEFCQAEWSTFLQRETLLGKPGSLITPIQFFDGEYYAASAKERQLIDMKPWATSAPAFRETREFLRFEAAVQRIAETLSTADGPIMSPAGYQNWPVVLPGAALQSPAIALPTFA